MFALKLMLVQRLNGTGYQRLAIQRYLEGDDLSWLWKSLFSKEGFGERPEKI